MAVSSALRSRALWDQTHATLLIIERKALMIAPTADSSEDLLTAAEVASLLRMTADWVYAETRAKRIPHLRLGRYVRYRRSAIERWMGEIEAGRTLSPTVSFAARRATSARRPRARA